MHISLLKHLKFGLYLWLWWIGTLGVSISAFLIFSSIHIVIVLFVILFFVVFSFMGITRTIDHIKLIKTYKRIHKLYTESASPQKSLLYSLQAAPCSNIIANDLIKEFNIVLTKY